MSTVFGDSDDRGSDRHPEVTAESSPARNTELPELLGGLRRRIDDLRTSADQEAVHQTGPAELALTVVAEALAIGEAMSRISTGSELEAGCQRQSPAIYGEIDSRFVEHRTRALRSALQGVDDYVWWGGLAAGLASTGR